MWVGLDISKETINYAIPNLRSEGHFKAQGRISNNINGFKMLEKQLLDYKDVQYKIACETTGIYSFPVMDYFSNLGWHCNEIHAFQTAWYKKTILSRAKTDKIDAKEIADYARRYKEKLAKPYVSRTPELIELALLMRMLNQIEKKQRAFLNISKKC